MNPLIRITGVAAPLLRDNINTDVIIPSREMVSVSKSGLVEGLFADWRYLDVAPREPDPGFVLNDARYRAASILLAGANFGCGSSREHAAWALKEYGFQAILASSFNPIFRNNCIGNAIAPVELAATTIAEIARFVGADPAHRLVGVDVAAKRVTAGPISTSFQMDDDAHQMLITGLDPIQRTLEHDGLIEAFLCKDRLARPWCYRGSVSQEKKGAW